MKYTEEVNKAIEAMKDKLDNDENSWFYYDEIETIFDLLEKQNKEIERLYKDNYRLDRENQLKFEKAVDTSDYVNKDKIREKIKELKDNRPYLSKFDDWKEKEYTNEDVTNKCVEVLEDLLGDE